MASRPWHPGEIFESSVYDAEWQDQGRVIWVVETILPAEGWLVCAMMAVEDAHLHWWVEKSEGLRFGRRFQVHVCETVVTDCGVYNGEKPEEFHIDYLRLLDAEDILARRASWWLQGCAKRDFEAFRSSIEEKMPARRGRASEAEALGFEPSEEDFGDGGDGERPERRSILGQELDRVKTESRPGRKKKEEFGKKPRRSRSPVRKHKKSPERRGRSRGRSEEPRGKDPGPSWFGSRGRPAAREREREERTRQTGKREGREARGSSESRKGSEKKKRRKDKGLDRGPYGNGEEVDFGGDSDSASEGSGFQGGASERRSHQLRLVEYARKMPGRLTSRLLLKMQSMLARDAEAPFNRKSLATSLTPPTATPYLQTIMMPAYRDRLGVKLLRELRTLAAALDEIAKGEIEVAGDILSQRLKALELQLSDGGWQRAQYFELIPCEGAGLAERAEQSLAAKEHVQELKMRQYLPHWSGKGNWSFEGKGKQEGKKGEKGNGKKGLPKGKWKTSKETDQAEKAPAA